MLCHTLVFLAIFLLYFSAALELYIITIFSPVPNRNLNAAVKAGIDLLVTVRNLHYVGATVFAAAEFLLVARFCAETSPDHPVYLLREQPHMPDALRFLPYYPAAPCFLILTSGFYTLQVVNAVSRLVAHSGLLAQDQAVLPAEARHWDVDKVQRWLVAIALRNRDLAAVYSGDRRKGDGGGDGGAAAGEAQARNRPMMRSLFGLRRKARNSHG